MRLKFEHFRLRARDRDNRLRVSPLLRRLPVNSSEFHG
jgi:hypothetical protein